MPAKKKRKRRKSASKKRSKSRAKHPGWTKAWIKRLAVLAIVALAGYTVYLDITLRWKFEGSRWSIPSHVYSRPLELYEGLSINKQQLISELELLGYRNQRDPASAGTYARSGAGARIHARGFTFWDGPSEPRIVDVHINGGTVDRLSSPDGKPVEVVRLEPRLFGSISPLHHEDRSLVQLQDVPSQLVQALLAIEDRNYFEHYGVDPRGLVRALWVNVTAGGLVQGGSTLTQQLVKNLYLSQERTVQRKITEMLMAVLLEVHYEKEDILETYINEVYLGQSGNRAIHGFGLASHFYFDRPLDELKLPELALLAALVKGASYYNPFRSPERAKKRRDLVINEMVELGYVDKAAAARARSAGLGVAKQGRVTRNENPAYLDFVRLQLRRDYQMEDLRTEGLHIFTTLDPLIQKVAEDSVEQRLAAIEKATNKKQGSLEAAVLVVRSDNGEVVAMVGGRRSRYAGFNRALEAERPVGSMIKPAVYLSAIEQGYSLASLLNDKPLTVEQPGAPVWKPDNYDNKFHGSVRLLDALSYSYNVATVRLGLEIGVDRVVQLLRRLGLNREIAPYPSMLLGAVSMTPVEMAQLYLGFASGGFRIPLRTTRSVMNQQRQPLARYPLSLQQVIDPAPLVVLNFGLQSVVSKGTAKALTSRFPPQLGLAGKTGTTDGYRDSWFAGYSGNYLTVVWVGRDDNDSTRLTGASGAMRIWSDIMAQLNLQPVDIPVPDNVEYVAVDTLGQFAQGCAGASLLPFVAGTLPAKTAACASNRPKSQKRREKRTSSALPGWLKDIFDEK